MNLEKLLTDIIDRTFWVACRDWDVASLACDSRQVEAGALFVALPGSVTDGNRFIQQAVDRGARVILSSHHDRAGIENKDVLFLVVANPFEIFKAITLRFYGDPSKKVQIVGITGTNGKTTVAYLVEAILTTAGKPCAVVGTVNHRIGDEVFVSHNTTPGFLENQQFLFNCVAQKVSYCVMEVSSHALDQGRVDAVAFDRAVFTNLTSDHLDYHKTPQAYFEAKSLLFKNLSALSMAVINNDDPRASELKAYCMSDVITYGLQSFADVNADNVQYGMDQTVFDLVTPQGEISVQTSLVGKFNVLNCLAAASVCLSWGLKLEDVQKGIAALTFVPGRLQRVDVPVPFTVFVDYAHTDDALEKVLLTLRELNTSRIILVFGCGGDRDTTKRKLMGHVASRLADFSIITTDNPRSEDPQAIAEEVASGFVSQDFLIMLDRQEALEKAIQSAQEGDIVLVAGKGHEDYQIFRDQTITFDDRVVIKEIVRCLP